MIAALSAALLLSPVGAGAQTTPAAAPPPPPPYGMSIGFEAAKKAFAAAEAEAKKNNWQSPSPSSTPAAIWSPSRGWTARRMPASTSPSARQSTANNFKRPTKALQDAIAQGGANLRLLAVTDVTPLEGGVPIVVDGKIIGAIGVSGVTANQDAEVRHGRRQRRQVARQRPSDALPPRTAACRLPHRRYSPPAPPGSGGAGARDSAGTMKQRIFG